MRGFRTAEQVAADEALSDAIEGCRRAYWPDMARNLVTDYVVVFAEVQADNADADVAVGRLVRDGNLPSYRIAGLLRQALKALDAVVFGPP